MAIWQYKLFALPKEEIVSYFFNKDSISDIAFNEIEWWRYRKIEMKAVRHLKDLLGTQTSWSKNIVQLGNLDSNCVEILFDERVIVEISIRIDLRIDYKNIVKIFCDFATENNCVFLNDSLRILEPEVLSILLDISDNNRYRQFKSNL